MLAVDFGREKRFKNLETADWAGTSVVAVESVGLTMASAGADETGDALFVDEAETEVVIIGGTSGGLVSPSLGTDCDPGPSTFFLGDCEAVLDGTMGGVPERSAIEVGLAGGDSVRER